MKELLVFDFDGTLADSLEASRRIFNRLASDYGLDEVALEDLPALRHLTLRQLLKKLGVKKRHLPAILRRGKAMLRDEMAELSPCEGLLEVLPEIRGGFQKCGILTSNSVENVEIFLRKAGIRHLFNFISSCRKLRGKAKYLKAISRTYSVEPQGMIYVGDEVRDVRACHKAGVPVVAVTWGFNSARALAASEPDRLVESAGVLREILAPGAFEEAASSQSCGQMLEVG